MNTSVNQWLLTTSQVFHDLGVVSLPPYSAHLKGHDVLVCEHGPITPSSKVIFWMQEAGYRLDVVLTRQCRDVARMVEDAAFFMRGLVFRKEDREIVPGTNAIMTWVSGNRLEFYRYFKVFLESIRRVDPDCQKFAFTNDLGFVIREKLEAHGFRIIETDPSGFKDIFKDRHEHFCNFLYKEGKDLKNVLICDSKDVLFQEDPFPWVESRTKGLPGYVLACSEGMKHSQSEWNTQDQETLQRGISAEHDFADWDVLNGGVLFGTPRELCDLCALTYMVTSQAHDVGWNCTDQASLNYVFRHRGLSDPRAEMLIASPSVHRLAAHGDSIKRGCFEAPYRLQGTKLFHDQKDQPFVLFHQWERTVFRDEILLEYSERVL